MKRSEQVYAVINRIHNLAEKKLLAAEFSETDVSWICWSLGVTWRYEREKEAEETASTEAGNMGIRFICDGEAVFMLNHPGHHLPVPDVDERIGINEKVYRVNSREWIADMKGIHVTVYLSLVSIGFSG